jgi:hypothetical protein
LTGIGIKKIFFTQKSKFISKYDVMRRSHRLSQAPALGHHARLFDGLRKGSTE